MSKHSKTSTNPLDSGHTFHDMLPRGSVILVQGYPGSGKTIFSAQFLYDGASRLGERGMYVSFFEDLDAFKRNAKSLGLDFSVLEQKGLIKIVHCISMTQEGMRDSIGGIVKAIVAFKPRRLVFDSISSVLQVMGHEETRPFLQTIFGTFARERRMTTLLVGEIPVGDRHTIDGVTDFIADGIVSLGRSPVHHFRTLTIHKMRGVILDDPNKFFTLKNGFHLIDRPAPTPIISKPRYWKPTEDSDTCFSTGSRDLDAILNGGYPKGQYVVLEVQQNVPEQVFRLFEFSLTWNFLMQQRGVLLLPTLIGSNREIETFVTRHAPTEALKRMRILERGRVPEAIPGEVSATSVPVVGKAPAEETWQQLDKAISELTQETGTPIARIIGFTSLENLFAGKGDLLLREIGDAIAENRYLGNVTLAVTRSNLAITKPLLALVNWHLRLIERNGYVFMRVVKPISTRYFAVGIETREGYPTLKLTPMV